ncbi:MAG: hypothetical protein ACTHJ0_11270 [Flavipsychrobacter sp.]
MNKDKYLGWVYTRTGLAISYICDTALICLFTAVLYRNIELNRPGFAWLSGLLIAFGILGVGQTFVRARKREENLDYIKANQLAMKQMKATLKNKKVDKNWLYIGILYPLAMAFLVFALMFSKRDSMQMYLGYGLTVTCIAAYHILRARYVRRSN